VPETKGKRGKEIEVEESKQHPRMRRRREGMETSTAALWEREKSGFYGGSAIMSHYSPTLAGKDAG